MANGITFSEVMAGGFALDETDPEAGFAKAHKEGTRLTMNARVTIPDLDRFVADPTHMGELGGSIDFAPLGLGMPATTGVFNLFSPTDNPELKLMVYEMGLQLDDKAYYVAGRKQVEDSSAVDLWSDTTTLYTTLHQGRDKNGPVIGAGVLSLGVKDIAELLATVEVTGTRSPLRVASTLATFGRFFMGELWTTYGPDVGKRLGADNS